MIIFLLFQVKPYVLDDQMCDECAGARCGSKFAPFFCANVTCLQVCTPHTHARTHTYTSTHTDIHTNTQRYACINAHTQNHSWVYTHTFTHTYAHTHPKHKHARTHTHAHNSNLSNHKSRGNYRKVGY